MNRKAFLHALAAQCLRMVNPTAALRDMLADPREETDAPCPVDALYRDAMRLGIDPASLEHRHLRAVIAAHREDDTGR